MSEHDYEALGLVAGLEIHQQLDTREKLFCACPTALQDPGDADHSIVRFLHPTRSELGEIDQAALEESRVEREFEYLAYDSTCLVEEDDEPPHRLDDEALEITLEIAQLLDMDVIDQVQVMRKIVVDGSNTTGFQRSALVARNGVIELDGARVSIDDLMVEEESAQRVEETDSGVQYSLDRLGIPLVEIGTGPDLRSPSQAREVAEYIGMLLRSTGQVKRGLGTIRQDVNISIAEGARVELKGVQRLDDIDDIVRLEVTRQVNLLGLRDDLSEREASVGDPCDVSGVFTETESGILSSVLDDDGVIIGVPLVGFDGLVGLELQPDRRFGTELADHAKRHGVGGIFHTDELPKYGITDDEVSVLRETLELGSDDAVALVAHRDHETAESAAKAVVNRARQGMAGVPEETRGVNENGTSRYLRPLPGEARMYPETDVPPVTPDVTDVEPPELLTEKATRYHEEYGLNIDLAEQVAYGRRWTVFEEAVERGVDPTLAATTLENLVIELRRDGVPVDQISDSQFLSVLDTTEQGELTKESLPEVVAYLADNSDATVDDAIDAIGVSLAGDSEVRDVIKAVVERNAAQVEAEGMDAFSGLMGECMAELRGRSEGETVSEILREEILARTE